MKSLFHFIYSAYTFKHFNVTFIASELPKEQPPTASGTQNVIVTTIRESTLLSVPLLVALIVCLLLLFVIVYRLKCAKRGKPKKFQVDDGDYLINGMYL